MEDPAKENRRLTKRVRDLELLVYWLAKNKILKSKGEGLDNKISEAFRHLETQVRKGDGP